MQRSWVIIFKPLALGDAHIFSPRDTLTRRASHPVPSYTLKQHFVEVGVTVSQHYKQDEDHDSSQAASYAPTNITVCFTLRSCSVLD